MPLGLSKRLGLLITGSSPTFQSITNISINGGTVRLTGTGFASATVTLGGGIGVVSTTTVSSTTLTFTAPAHAVGTIDVTVTNADGGYVFIPGGLSYVTVSDPSTILSGNLTGWYRGDSFVQSGGLLTGWTDKSGNSNGLSVPATFTGATYNASSANFAGFPTATFNGTSDVLAGTFNNLSGHTQFIYVVYRLIVAGAAPAIANMAFTSAAEFLVSCFSTTGQPSVTYNANSGTTWGSAIVGTSTAIYGYVVGTGASTDTVGINLTNLTEINASGSFGTQPTTSGNFRVGARFNGTTYSNFANVEIAEIIVANVQPTTSQLNQLFDYINFRYLIDPTVTFMASTAVSTAGGLVRVEGAGFNASTNVSMQGVGALATTVKSSTNLQFTVPASSAGSYDLTFNNANDGQTLTVHNGITVTTVADAMTIFGQKCVAWARADDVVLNGSTIAAFTDRARMGNKITQPTAANQPTYTASSSTSGFNNQATATFAGSPVTMSGTINFDAGTSSMFIIAVMRVTSASGVPFDYATPGVFEIRMDGSGKPESYRNGTVAVWGSSIQNLTKKVYAYNQSTGTSLETMGIAVDFGTEVTNSAAITNLIGGQTLWVASQAATTYVTMELAEFIILDQMASGPELTAIASYLTGRYT